MKINEVVCEFPL